MSEVSSQPWSRHLYLLAAVAAAGTMSCSGQISRSPESSHDGVSRGDDGEGDTVRPDEWPPGVDPGTKGVHRLNAAEYNATVADVLGTKLAPANASWLGGQLGLFDNIAAVLNVDEDQFKRYLQAANQIADDVFGANNLKANLLICSGEDAACVQSIIANMGLRLFRRPLQVAEAATFNTLYSAARAQGETRDGGLKYVLRGVLSSADFLFRIETDLDAASAEKHPLNAYELASRLSYFLWSSAPDEALLAAAADGSLLKQETLLKTVDRMLNDPAKSSRFVENFGGQWLGVRQVPQHAVDVKTFPDWSEPLATSLSKEMYMFFAEFVTGDRSWLDFLRADVNFVDASVAKLYGGQSGGSTAMQRIEIRDDQRFGFAGLGGFLAMTSQDQRTSPTKRGSWILTHLLCTEPPPPPPAVAKAIAESQGFDPTKNVRATLEEHRTNPGCAACHASFDPYGLSLEQFDAIGKYRTAYADGSKIDVSAKMEDTEFSGLSGLVETVTNDPKFSECLPEFLLNYALGRPIVESDRPYLYAIHKEWIQETPSIRRLVGTLVSSEPFRYRRAAASR